MRIELTITLPTLHLGTRVIEDADVVVLADVFPAERDVGIDGPYCEVVDLRSLTGRPLDRLMARAARAIPDIWAQLDERATEHLGG